MQWHATIALRLACLIPAACAPHLEPMPGTTVARDYARAAGHWRAGGMVQVAVGHREVDGRLAVCGAWSQNRQRSVEAGFNAALFDAAVLYLGEERLFQDIGFLPEVSHAAHLTGRPAACRLTDRPWQPGDADRRLRVKFSEVIINLDRNSHDKVAFQQDRPHWR